MLYFSDDEEKKDEEKGGIQLLIYCYFILADTGRDENVGK